MDRHEAGCLCGALRVTATGAPLRVGLCHCLDCRKHHGALFYGAAIFSAQAVVIEGPFSAFQGRCFCPTCGSSVFARTGDEVEVHLGAFDAPGRFQPTYEVWCERRESWLPPVEGTTTHRRNREAPEA
ncbi:GFA family protein [Gymnodinialimonas ceratoperidinii]|uniref:GFA family protein n=1 Tax=Gymnodinialimonas ceratoperidinii TaxID=2856823 RepID=A0A8F6YE06_9RHOB|nr:GFA family protein [Gymnodinialimonas ceratoperidinii]QXT41080.1 GFA family protein [Gymnodinialimonas ceratoperidinii]